MGNKKHKPFWACVAISSEPLPSERGADYKEPPRGKYPSTVYDLNAIKVDGPPCFPLRFTREENQALLDGREPNGNK